MAKYWTSSHIVALLKDIVNCTTIAFILTLIDFCLFAAIVIILSGSLEFIMEGQKQLSILVKMCPQWPPSIFAHLGFKSRSVIKYSVLIF